MRSLNKGSQGGRYLVVAKRAAKGELGQVAKGQGIGLFVDQLPQLGYVDLPGQARPWRSAPRPNIPAVPPEEASEPMAAGRHEQNPVGVQGSLAAGDGEQIEPSFFGRHHQTKLNAVLFDEFY